MAHADGFPMRYTPFEEAEDDIIRCDICQRPVFRDGRYYKVGNRSFCVGCE